MKRAIKATHSKDGISHAIYLRHQANLKVKKNHRESARHNRWEKSTGQGEGNLMLTSDIRSLKNYP